MGRIESKQVLPSFTKFDRVLPSFTEFYRVLPSLTGFKGSFTEFLPRVERVVLINYWVLLGFTMFYWASQFFLPSLTGFDWVLQGFTEFYWVSQV